MDFWVIPRIVSGRGNGDSSSAMGGWKCVHVTKHESHSDVNQDRDDMILPSKAAILNKIRWALSEKKTLKNEALQKQINIKNEDKETGNLL
mmetsp:Transcript_16946/g.30400  ORF Transcript_16946/g.30400 Transcript_16946/m.30400 type:complete len:91 (+) Transcript_16946:3-275(+)